MFLRKMTAHVRLVPAMAVLSLLASGCTPTSLQNAFETNIPPEEEAQIAEITRLTPDMQNIRALVQNGAVLRGVHPKSHGCVSATFTVNDDIDEQFRVGLFASPGKIFDAGVRFSNAAVSTGDDLALGGSGERENGSRGMAVKVRNVGGNVFIKDKNENNQDFLMINTPEFAFRNSRDYLRLTQALHASENAFSPLAYFGPTEDADFKVGIAATKKVIFAPPDGIKHRTVRNPLHVQYFGAAPFLFGEGGAMKFSAKPCDKEIPQKPFTKIEKDTLPKDYLRAALTETMKGNEDVCLDFMIQVRGEKEVSELNIEDATTRWPNELDNYKSVAQIIIEAPQRPDTPEAIANCEAQVYTPWHSLKEHRPLGSINRLRRKVYKTSADHRLGATPAKP
ncbi:MAG: catalase [Proteobacteria bacterium]|nr:catalase [Pseudomonadota bacterium]